MIHCLSVRPTVKKYVGVMAEICFYDCVVTQLHSCFDGLVVKDRDDKNSMRNTFHNL